MSIRNTPSLTQFPFYNSVQLTTANTNYTSPTNTALLAVAGPDGLDLWTIAAIITANQASNNQVQLFHSPDGGTTFNFMPLSLALASGNIGQTSAATSGNFAMPNGVPMTPSNPLVLAGRGLPFTYPMTNSVLTESTTYYAGQAQTGGTANAQTIASVFNSAGTQLAATPATGTILDFVAGVTNTTTTTIAPGLQVATAIKRDASTQLSAGDITKGFRYRAIFDGTQWILLLTDRIYAACGQTQAITVSAWGAHR